MARNAPFYISNGGRTHSKICHSYFKVVNGKNNLKIIFISFFLFKSYFCFKYNSYTINVSTIIIFNYWLQLMALSFYRKIKNDLKPYINKDSMCMIYILCCHNLFVKLLVDSPKNEI